MPERSPIRPFARVLPLAALFFAGPAAAADPPPGSPPALPEPVTLDLGLRIGPSVRVGASTGLPITDRAGLALAVGAWVTPTPRFTLGLSYENVGLGREVGGNGNPDFADVSRSLNTLWADLRLHLFRSPVVRLSALIGLGMNWQSASATAALSQEVGQPPLIIHCSASASANLSFRAGLGAQFMIGSGFSFLLDGVVDEVRLSSDPLDDCVNGGGTMTLLSARAGLAYQFDVSRLAR